MRVEIEVNGTKHLLTVEGARALYYGLSQLFCNTALNGPVNRGVDWVNIKKEGDTLPYRKSND